MSNARETAKCSFTPCIIQRTHAAYRPSPYCPRCLSVSDDVFFFSFLPSDIVRQHCRGFFLSFCNSVTRSKNPFEWYIFFFRCYNTDKNTPNPAKMQKEVIKSFDPDVIRTRNLLIWSQTRYRCATESDEN